MKDKVLHLSECGCYRMVAIDDKIQSQKLVNSEWETNYLEMPVGLIPIGELTTWDGRTSLSLGEDTPKENCRNCGSSKKSHRGNCAYCGT